MGQRTILAYLSDEERKSILGESDDTFSQKAPIGAKTNNRTACESAEDEESPYVLLQMLQERSEELNSNSDGQERTGVVIDATAQFQGKSLAVEDDEDGELEIEYIDPDDYEEDYPDWCPYYPDQEDETSRILRDRARRRRRKRNENLVAMAIIAVSVFCFIGLIYLVSIGLS